MNDKENNIIIGEKPILQFGFYHNETDDFTKAFLVADNDNEQVEQSPLNPEEKALLAEYEKEIDEGLEGFVVVGQRLSQIKSQGLFREKYPSFHQYCLARFGFGRSYAKRVIGASKCLEDLQSVPIGTVCIPANEAQARCLIGLSPEDQVKVAKQTKKDVDDREPTAKDFEKAKNKVIPGKSAKNTAKAKPKDEAKEGVQSKSKAKAYAEPIVVDSVAARKVVALTNELSGVGLPTFQEMSQMAEKIASLTEEPEQKSALKVEIARLRTALHNYARLESLKEAA